MSESVTIILSNYNHGRFLPESLRHICEQSRPADKILVIDDGSTDNSVNIIEGFEQRYDNLRLIKNSVNIGLQASIEKVLPLVVTDCIVWSASDDLLLPNFLEKSMAVLERHPKAGLVFSELTVLKGETGIISRFAEEPSVAHIYDLRDLPEFADSKTVCARMKRSYFPPTSNSVVVRMWALKDVGYFRASLEWHSDWLAYNAIAVKFGACVVAETLALIRERDDSYSAVGRRDPDQQARVLDAMLDVLSEPGLKVVKEVFERYPSYYKVWGREILPILRRKRGFFRTYLNYRFLLAREFRIANGLSWRQFLLSKLPMVRMGIFKRQIVPPEPPRSIVAQLKSENDALAQELRMAQHTRDLRDRQLTRVIQDRDKYAILAGEFSGEAEQARVQLERIRKALAQADADLREERSCARGLRVALQSCRDESDKIGSVAEDAKEHACRLANELEEVKAECARLTDELALASENETAMARKYDETKQQVNDALSRIASLEEELRGAQVAMSRLSDMYARNLELETELYETRDALLQCEEEKEEGEKRWQNSREELHLVREELQGTQTVAENYRVRLENSRVRSILVTSMPKSGTYYISKYLSRSLLVEESIVGNQYFPNDVVNRSKLISFSEGNCVSQDHFDGAPINLRHIESLMDHVIVQVRDPRQATLSYIHFLDTDHFKNNEEFTRNFIYPKLPDEFYKWDLEARLDWGIKCWLPLLVEWVETWIIAERETRLKIKFTRFEDMVDNELAFFREILNFVGVPNDRFQEPIFEKNSAVHFRAGLKDEWMNVFNPLQRKAAAEQIPAIMCSRFGWLNEQDAVCKEENSSGALNSEEEVNSKLAREKKRGSSRKGDQERKVSKRSGGTS